MLEIFVVDVCLLIFKFLTRDTNPYDLNTWLNKWKRKVLLPTELVNFSCPLVILSFSFQSRGTLKRKGEAGKAVSHHLYLCMRDFGHYVGETTDVYISLYDAKKAKYIRRVKIGISRERWFRQGEFSGVDGAIFVNPSIPDVPYHSKSTSVEHKPSVFSFRFLLV